MSDPTRIGVLALQGNFREHAAMLRRLGADAVEVRRPDQLTGVDGLVVPGGESTAIGRLMRIGGLEEPVATFPGALLGTCAGMILLRTRPARAHRRRAARNAFGRQVASFEADVELQGEDEPLRGVFIRAPRIVELGPEVEVLGTVEGEPVLVRRGARAGRVVPSGADRRHARARAVPRARAGGEPCRGIASGRRIKHKKGAADAKRGKLFSKLTRAIIVAAQRGRPRTPTGTRPSPRPSRRPATARCRRRTSSARSRAAPGASADGEAYETVTYEGYGDGGVAVFVEALTDNRNRTAAEVRHIFAKNDGNLGTSGAVAWLFERKGILIVAAGSVDEDELMLVAADGGAEDVDLDGSSYQVTAAPDDLAAVRAALDDAGIAYESAELTMLPKTTVAVEEEGTRARSSSASWTTSRKTTTSRRSTRTSTSPRGSSKPSPPERPRFSRQVPRLPLGAGRGRPRVEANLLPPRGLGRNVRSGA